MDYPLRRGIYPLRGLSYDVEIYREFRFSLAVQKSTHFQTKTEGVTPIRDVAAGQAFQNRRESSVQPHLRLINFSFHLTEVTD